MSSSYSSLDWGLSHWAHFTVHRFICVYFFVFLFYTAYVLYYYECSVPHEHHFIWFTQMSSACCIFLYFFISIVLVANKQPNTVLILSTSWYLSLLIVHFSLCLYGVLFCFFFQMNWQHWVFFIFNSLTVALLLFVYKNLCKQN